MTQVRSDRVFVTCKPCEFVFVAALLPMEMRKLAKLMKSLRCPRCAEKKYLAVATADEARRLPDSEVEE